MRHTLAGSKGVQVGSTFLLTPAPVLAESVAVGVGGGGAVSILELPLPSTLVQGLLARDDFRFSFP